VTIKRYSKDGRLVLSELKFGTSTLIGDATEDTAIGAPVWILTHNELSSRAVRLWMYMRGALNGVLSIPGTSHRSIATLLDVSDSTAERTIYELRDAGAIHVVPTFFEGQQLGNIYYLWPAQPDGGVITSEVGGSSPVKSGIINTNINTNTTQDSATPQKRNKSNYTEEFEAVWKIYPRRINKAGAFKAYTATLRKGVEPSVLMIATKNYASTRIGQDETYTLHGQTFFGPTERWRDFGVNADSVVAVHELTDEQMISARLYEDFDNDSESLLDNPAKSGYNRPTNAKGELVDINGVPYALDAQGQRRSMNYWK